MKIAEQPISVLSESVLVLNSHWKPISTTTVARALNKLINRRFKVVGNDYQLYDLEGYIDSWQNATVFAKAQENECKMFNHPDFRFPVPEVVLATEYDGYYLNLYTVKFSRKNVFLRDKNICQYCGKLCSKDHLNIDHVIPSSQGGLTIWENVVLSCIRCNTKKADRTPKQANMSLLKMPRKPSALEIGLKIIPTGKIPKSWEDFLGKMYWEVELKK